MRGLLDAAGGRRARGMTATAIGWIAPDWPVAGARARAVDVARRRRERRAVCVAQPGRARRRPAPRRSPPTGCCCARRRTCRQSRCGSSRCTARDVVRHEACACAGQRPTPPSHSQPGRVCAVMTADCLPVVFADRARHARRRRPRRLARAGWPACCRRRSPRSACRPPSCMPGSARRSVPGGLRGRAGGARGIPGRRARQRGAASPRNERGRYLADLYGLARRVLRQAGVSDVHGGGWCTHDDAERFFSFRRDGVTGRMATLAWLA